MNSGIDDYKDHNVLQSAIEKALQQTVSDMDERMASNIRDIVAQNLATGRVQRFLNVEGNTPRDYVKRVESIYRQQHKYIEMVWSGSNDIWEELYVNMQHWAYHFLLRNGFRSSADTFALAVSYASEAAAYLIQARYPYDVERFEFWAVELVKNVCRKFMRKAVSSSNIPEAKLDPLDASFDDLSLGDLEGYVEHKEFIRDFIKALSQLDEREQLIITCLIEERNLHELAQELGISTGHIYKLKSTALQKLRKLLAAYHPDESIDNS